ncbi:MAG: hypothetical protein ACRDP8_08985 [Actinopolymorphaceae bacterium]
MYFVLGPSSKVRNRVLSPAASICLTRFATGPSDGVGVGVAVPGVEVPVAPGDAETPGVAAVLGELVPGDVVALGVTVPEGVGTGLSVALAIAVRLGTGLGDTTGERFTVGVVVAPSRASELEQFAAEKPMRTPQRRMSSPRIIDEIRGDNTPITPLHSVSSDICRESDQKNFGSEELRRDPAFPCAPGSVRTFCVRKEF